MTNLVIACVLFTFGFFEFSDWLGDRTGFIEGVMIKRFHLNFSLLLNPFLATYLVLPLACSAVLKEKFRDGVLSRFSILLNPWVIRFAPLILGLCLALLANQLRKILIILNAKQSLVPDQHASIFLSIIGITFLIQLFLMNLPELKVLNDKMLAEDITGLYGLKPGQFIIQSILGESRYTKLAGPNRYYKEKSTIWYVFSEGSADLEESFLPTDIGHLQVQWTLWAVVGDFNSIRTKEIQLSQIGSAEQFYSAIRREFVYEFRSKLTEGCFYESIDKLIKHFFNGELASLAYRSEESLGQIIEGSLIHLAIDHLIHELITATSIEATMHGQLYTIYARLDQVSLKPSLADRLARFEQHLSDLTVEWYQRRQTDRQFGLEFVSTVSEAMERVQGLLPRSMQNDIYKAFTDRIMADLNGCISHEDLQNLKDRMEAIS